MKLSFVCFIATLFTIVSCIQSNVKSTEVISLAATDTIMKDTIPVQDTFASYHDEFKGKSITGHFTYYADAASFKFCYSNKTLPVSMEGEYKKTEKAYLNSVENGGDPAFIEVLGAVLKRENMEGNIKDHLVIDQLIELNLYRNCEER